jgi:hypothetical protein
MVDVDNAFLEVDVVPGECLQFASAEAGVEGGCPECLIPFRECRDQGCCVGGVGDAVAFATDGGQ